jgi:hypothetical protein
VAGSRLNKVLIIGGSGLNVLFTKTLKKMKLYINHMLTKSTSPFYGIVPGNTAIPLGSVVLPVTFGETRENYCTKYIKFEVADFETSYPAILGRPAIAKFMAVPHYTYLVLKMPSPAGVLSLQGDLKMSIDCDTEAVELAATNQVPNAMMEIYAASKKLAPSELDIPEKSDKANKPHSSEEVQVKAIDLRTGDSSKTTMIGAALLPRLLLRVPPDCYQGRRPGEDRVHHPVRRLLLQDHVVRVEEHRRYLPASHPGLFQETAQQERRSLRG